MKVRILRHENSLFYPQYKKLFFWHYFPEGSSRRCYIFQHEAEEFIKRGCRDPIKTTNAIVWEGEI